MYNVRVVADSMSPHGHRLVTMEARFPRFLLPEINTHRMLSRNSASNRAMPPEALIEEVRTNPFIPEFNERVKGMGVGKALEGRAAVEAEDLWLRQRSSAVLTALRLIDLKVDKSRVNRLLEPFMWHTVLATASDWANFFALRTHSAAQPEMRKIALMMQHAYETGKPWHCPTNCWHLPLVELSELSQPIDYPWWRQVSAGRCARISYMTHDGKRDPALDIGLHNQLLADHHLSPFEHPARPFSDREWEIIRDKQERLRTVCDDLSPEQVEAWCRQLEYSGNFRGWRQYRAEVPDQHDYSLVAA